MGYFHPRTGSLFNPSGEFFGTSRSSNAFLASGRISRKVWNERVFVQASASNLLFTSAETHDRLLLREAYGVVSLSEHWDVTAGKKLLKWGTGIAFNPTGFLDPPKNPRDPNDRLELNQGTELVQADYVRGNRAVNVVYFAPRLYFWPGPIRSRDGLAFRYNQLWKGLDFSVMALYPSQASPKFGANFSHVVGRSLELHGELAWGKTRGSCSVCSLMQGLVGPPLLVENTATRIQGVVGFNYTLPGGWTLAGELNHDSSGWRRSQSRSFYDWLEQKSDEALEARESQANSWSPALQQVLTALQQLSEVRQSRNNLFFMASRFWDHQRLGCQLILLTNLNDVSSILIPQLNLQLKRNWAVYLRGNLFLGAHRSEYGSFIYDTVFNLGLRYNL